MTLTLTSSCLGSNLIRPIVYLVFIFRFLLKALNFFFLLKKQHAIEDYLLEQVYHHYHHQAQQDMDHIKGLQAQGLSEEVSTYYMLGFFFFSKNEDVIAKGKR